MKDICIGIISYFPDDERVHEVRKNRLKELLQRLSFNLPNYPIFIIAQNWTSDDINDLSNSNIQIETYEKLGITKARETLRLLFINSDYSWLFCIDDDFEINKNKSGFKKYISMLHKYKKGVIVYENYLMNLFSISKDIASKYSFLDCGDAELNTGYEDWVYVSVIENVEKNNFHYVNNLNLPSKKRKDLVNDSYSTWLNQINRQDLTKQSRALIDKLTEKYLPRQKETKKLSTRDVRSQVSVIKRENIKTSKDFVKPTVLIPSLQKNNLIQNIKKGNNTKIDLVIIYNNYNIASKDSDLDINKHMTTKYLKYLFRSVEKNCAWVNKIFLVVPNGHHVPSWLNVSLNKLRILYHEDFIPEKYLPTFNIDIVKLYLPEVYELSDNYVVCDNNIFMNKTSDTQFFISNLPVYEKILDRENLTDKYDCLFKKVFEKDYNKFSDYYFPKSHKKSVNKVILENFEKDIDKIFTDIKFNLKKSINDLLFVNYIKNIDLGIDRSGLHSYCKEYVDNVDYIKNSKIVAIKNFDDAISNYLETNFKEKSMYEK